MGGLNIVIPLPEELEPIRSKITMFFDAMIYKLRVNAHKGAWENINLYDAINFLHGEISELMEAIDEGGNTTELVLEAADIANFALIIANIAHRDAGNHGRQDAEKADGTNVEARVLSKPA